MNFILKNSIEKRKNLYLIAQPVEGALSYLHYTKLPFASKILAEGFLFNPLRSFSKTTNDVGSGIEDNVNWIHVQCHQYGLGVVNIQVASTLLTKGIEYLVEDYSIYDEEAEALLYRLPKQYVRGYVDLKENELVWNPDFDPYFFDEKQVKWNLENLHF